MTVGVGGKKDSQGWEVKGKGPGFQVEVKHREPGSPDAGTPAPSPSGGGDVKKKDEPKTKEKSQD